jgi:hypothetical protein
LVQVALGKNIGFCQSMPSRVAQGVHRIAMKRLNIQNIIVSIDFSKMSVQASP